jgi:hypothetical protein
MSPSLPLSPRKPVPVCKPDPARPKMRPVILRPEAVAQVGALCALDGDAFDDVVHDAIALLYDGSEHRIERRPGPPSSCGQGQDGGGEDRGLA